MSQILSGGIPLRRFGTAADPPNARQLATLNSSIGLLPVEHLAILSRVEARRLNQPPTRGGGNDPRAKVIRLSAVSFAASENSDVNLTFLHEMGHVVDWHYGCTRQIQSWAHQVDHPFHEDATALLNTPHIGATQWAGEKIADCYMVLMRSLVVSRPYASRSCPYQYQGEQANRRFRVLLNTTAFRNISEEQLRNASDEGSFRSIIASLAN